MRDHKIIVILCIFLFAAARGWALNAPRDYEQPWDSSEYDAKTEYEIVWNDLLSREIDPEKVYSLMDLIVIAVKNNPSTQDAWEKARSAKAEANQAYGDWLPEITSTGSLQKQKVVAHPAENNKNKQTYGATIDGSYKLFDFGARTARSKAASENLLSANYAFNQAYQDMVLAVETAYYTLESTQSNIAAQEANVKDAETDMDATGRRFKAGLVSKLDVLQAESAFLKAKYDLVEAKGDFKASQAQLVQALGVPASIDLKIQPIGNNRPGDIAEEKVKALLETAIKERPDLAALRAKVQASINEAKASWGDLWPVFSVGGSAGKTWEDTYGPEKNYANEYQYTGYVKFDWDMFDGLENINKAKQADADAASLQQQLIEAELAASAEVWTKFYYYKANEEQMTFAEQFLITSEMSYELAQEGYSAGLKSILDLTKAQSDLFSARTEAITARKELFVSFAELIHATGRLEGPNRTEETL